jgi:hypothetical protein
LAIPATQAAEQNYALLKNAYIQNHPGQPIIPFPWEPSTSIRVLPFNFEIPAGPANNFSITASRNQFEAASFIINAQKDLSGINIIVPDLYDNQGNIIPSSAINVRLVKVWYQAAPNDIWYTTAGYNLTPELLLKDDSLVKVDYGTKTNYLKVTINGVQQYIDISSPTATVPETAQIRDAATLQPFSLKANENKQIWITVHVPGTTPAGNYSGNITINAPSETPVMMNFSVRVLPFDLEPAPLDYGLYYFGVVTGPLIVGDFRKTDALYAIELENMKDHGVLYPSLYALEGNQDTVLAIRNTVGLPKDKIYVYDIEPGHTAYIGNAQDPAGLTTIANKVLHWRNITESYGYTTTYFYGIDEAKGTALSSQRPAWQTVHNNGGKMWASVSKDGVDRVGDLLDVAVLYGGDYAWDYDAWINRTSQIKQYHSYGNRVFSYGNPQSGVENPEIYRNNYGFTLWNNGYDGAMDFAYQFNFGQTIWNDYDDPGWAEDGLTYHYRDHVFAYPTSNGVIDTIQWEGWREGVDDTRYVASLIKKEGSIISAKTIVSAGLSNNKTMATIRKNVIDQILLYQVNRAPVLAAIENKTVDAGSLLTFTVNATDPDGNNLTFSASNLPLNATFNTTTRIFDWIPTASQGGIYKVTFVVTDGSLSDSVSVWITVNVKADQTTPICFFCAVIPEYVVLTVLLVIVGLFGLVVYAMRFWRG